MKLSAYAAALAFVLGGAWAAGTAAGLVLTTSAADDGKTHGGDLAGLVSTQSGYTFTPAVSVFDPGRNAEFAFRINGPDGMPVTRFDVKHDKRMHLIVVRWPTCTCIPKGHPEMGRTAAGPQVVFVAEVPSAGDYRLFLDFQHQGTVRTAELTLPAAQGQPQPTPCPQTDPSHGEGLNGAGHG